MTKHLFFTGERAVGKTTLIRRLRDRFGPRVAGFRTLPFGMRDIGYGFYILGQQETPLTVPGSDRIIAMQDYKGGIAETRPETFERAGVKLLTASVENQPDLIIMDELGFLESEAQAFQQAVLSCLDGNVPVWGVIKPIESDFLDAVRKHPDVTVIEVTAENRNRLFEEIAAALKPPWQRG